MAQEPLVRLGMFIGVFLLIVLWELRAPRRPLSVARTYRWLNNLGIVVMNTLVLRVFFPAAAVGIALLAEEKGLGLLNTLALPVAMELLIAFLVLDFAIWAQHLVFHHVPWLWRLHRMHHADLDFDVTTGLRFHPLEILLSMLIKGAVILVLGAPAVAVLVFEVVLNATSMFNHGNVRLPGKVDAVLRWFVVTPEMHRVHHSWYPEETNSNYGFNLPWWDRLLGTYRAQPRDGHRGMTIGLHRFRQPGELRFDRMLVQPLRGAAFDPPCHDKSSGR